MGRIAHSTEFGNGQVLPLADPAELHSLGEVTRFLQHYLDCEVAVVAPADAEGACAMRGADGGQPVDADRTGTLADPVAARASGMRFYAGLPLRDAAGRCVGTLAAMDGAERPLSGEQLQMMRRLAGVAAHLCGPTRHD